MLALIVGEERGAEGALRGQPASETLLKRNTAETDIKRRLTSDARARLPGRSTP